SESTLLIARESSCVRTDFIIASRCKNAGLLTESILVVTSSCVGTVLLSLIFTPINDTIKKVRNEMKIYNLAGGTYCFRFPWIYSLVKVPGEKSKLPIVFQN